HRGHPDAPALLQDGGLDAGEVPAAQDAQTVGFHMPPIARCQAERIRSTVAFASIFCRAGSASHHAMEARTPSAKDTLAWKRGTTRRSFVLSKTRLHALSPRRLAPRRSSMRAMKSEGTWTIRGSTPITRAIVSWTWFQVCT